ncbi:MAG: isoprenylcysteine carboxylmethyltransferase family protein [Phycisphaerae bacterium]|nr:isoprenylcysteine carboxylmethyltransferase family protein [Phycisphaerae bacterium]
MSEWPWQTVVFVAVQLAHGAVLRLATRGRGAASVRRGYVTTVIWAVTFFVPLLAALWRLDWRTEGVRLALYVPAMAVIAVGVALRIWGLAHLRRFFSELIVIRQDHRLITSGPYRLLRHPLHVGLLLQIVGFAVIANSWWVWVLAGLAVVSAFPRERSEERALAERFGEEYRDWHRRTYGLTDVLPGGGGRKVGR